MGWDRFSPITVRQLSTTEFLCHENCNKCKVAPVDSIAICWQSTLQFQNLLPFKFIHDFTNIFRRNARYLLHVVCYWLSTLLTIDHRCMTNVSNETLFDFTCLNVRAAFHIRMNDVVSFFIVQVRTHMTAERWQQRGAIFTYQNTFILLSRHEWVSGCPNGCLWQ